MKTIIVGVGGPTNSGKTTLAKHILKLINDSRPETAIMLHQDDFALPEAQLPWNDTLQARDWDHPVGTIDYSRMNTALEYVREHGQLPVHHSSHDHLNLQPETTLDVEVQEHCRELLTRAISAAGVDRIVLADGFLLYYDERVKRQMDIRLFLQCSRAVLEHRREHRGGYATAEGTVWQDPPGYFEHVIWPGYILAHAGVFQNQDVERGMPIKVDVDAPGDGKPIHDLISIPCDDVSINSLVTLAVEEMTKRIGKR